jgi:NAD(P)-dependent dehydrogenase (short-subunit alcohol dehydrogenase family)
MGDRLQGKVAIVTGSGRGIGRGVALALAEEGAKVVVNDYGVAVDGSQPSSGPAQEVADEIKAAGGEAVANYGNVASVEDGEAMVKQALDTFGRLDILVNVAGILRDRMVFNMAEEEWDAVIATHLKGTFNCGHFASIAMRQQRSGSIITFTSSAHEGNAGQSNYSAAKGGIASMTYTWAVELGKYGVRANSIAPIAATRMLGTIPESTNERRVASGTQPSSNLAADPEEVGNVVAFLVSDEARTVTGQVVGVSAGKVTIWQHPRERWAAYTDDMWTVEGLRQHFIPAFGGVLEPYGIRQTQYRPPHFPEMG